MILLVAVFIADREFFQTYNYEELKIEKELYAQSIEKNESINIGIIWPFHEDGEPMDNFKEGAEFAIETINSKGGILGREVKGIFQDDKIDIKTSVKIAKKFASNKKIFAVVAHAFSNQALHSSITYNYSGVVMISPGATDPLFIRDEFKYIFRTIPNDIKMGKAMTKLAKIKNFQKVVVVHEQSKYARVIANTFIENALELGIEVVYKENFHPNEELFTNIITNISPITNYSIDYDAVVAIGSESAIPNLIKNSREKGIYAKFLTTDMLDIKNIEKSGDFMEDTIIATIFNPEILNIKTQNFIEKFKNRYDFDPDTWALQGYDALMLLAKAIEVGNSLNPIHIADNLRYIRNFDSIFGTYSMLSNGDIDGKEIYFKIIKNGKFKYLTLN